MPVLAFSGISLKLIPTFYLKEFLICPDPIVKSSFSSYPWLEEAIKKEIKRRS